MSLTCVPCKLLTAESLVDHLARVHPDQTFTIDVDPASDSAVIHAPGVPMTVEWPDPSPRRRLTAVEFDAEAAKAKTEIKPLRTRTGRRRSWWQRGWKR